MNSKIVEVRGEEDARSISAGASLRADVCVVGAGPAGITLGMELARAGASVLLLEAGGRERDANAVEFSKAESAGDSYFPIHTTRSRGFGGTSALWIPGMFRAAPLTSLDFQVREGIRYTGWPIERSVLDRYYEAAIPWCGLNRYDFRDCTWETPDRPALKFTEGAVRTVVFQSADKDIWRNRYAQVRSTSNLRLLLHAHVVELCTASDGSTVERLRVRTLTGTEFNVVPRAVVLAAGGIENARLLLLSRDRNPSGLGNGHDLVGRFFQEHLALRGGIIRLADERTPMGLYLMHRHPSGAPVQGKIVVDEDTLRRRGLLGCAFFVTHVTAARADAASRSVAVLRRSLSWQPRPPDLARHTARALRGLPVAARAIWEEVRGHQEPDTYQLLSEAEQSPNPESRVTLSQRQRDPLGLPRARLEWRIDPFDRQSIAELQKIIDEGLRASGIGRLERMIGEEDPPEVFAGHWHHMGTTRMHDDPRQGVVDRNCRVHGVSNLFVAGSSVFPTSGYANPVFTIVALALRLAEHLTRELPALVPPTPPIL